MKMKELLRLASIAFFATSFSHASLAEEISQHDIDTLNTNMYNLNMAPGEEIIDVIPQEYIIDAEQGLKVN